MLETILGIAFFVVILFFFAAIMSMAFEDTEAFRAIDEKIARLIRGKEE